jgi:hypothetical protein
VRDTGKNLLEPKFYGGIAYNKAVGEKATASTGIVDITNRVTVDGNKYSQTGRAWELPMSMLVDVSKYVGKTICLSGTFTGNLNISNGLRSAWYLTDENYIVKRVSSMFNLNPPFTLTIAEGEKYLIWYIQSSADGTIILDSPQVELGTTATSYAPYTGQTVTVPLNDLYGGNVDVIGGQSKETWANISSYNGETISEPWLSSMDEYVSGATPTTGAQVTYKLATPTDLTTTPTDVELYKGDNVVSGDGDMTMTYVRNLQMVIDKIEAAL